MTSEPSDPSRGIRWFDGFRWSTDAHHDDDRLSVPTLVDSGVGLIGYRESLRASVTTSTDAIARLLLRHGVDTVVDLGSSHESRYRMAAVAPELDVIVGGPVLTNGELSSECDRTIRDEETLRRSLDAFKLEGVSIISVRTDDADFVRSCAAGAHERGQRISLFSSRLPVDQILDTGVDILAGAHQMLSAFRRTSTERKASSPLEMLEITSESKARAAARRVAEAGIAVTTGLISLRRSCLPKEALDAPYLEDLLPIFPHSRHLLEMKRAGGYIMGRRQLATNAGIKEPSPTGRRAILDTWQYLLTAINAFREAGGRVLPASFAPGFGVVPGYSLKEEVTLLAHLFGSIDVALQQATGGAREFFRTEFRTPPNARRLEARKSDYGLDLALKLTPASSS